MTPDELRALADALDRLKFRCDGIDDACLVEDAADYLRACADEKAVGYVTANGLRSLRQDDATVLLYAHDYLIRPDHVALYTHPAPAAPQAMEDANVWKQIVPDDEPQAEPSAALIRAYNSGYMQGHHDTVESCFTDIHQSDMDTFHADVVAELGLTAAPQAEPCIGNDSACPCQDGDACHYKDAADGTKAWPVPQAEPKREPLSDGQVTDLWSWASGQDQGPETTQQHAFARAVERAAYERAAQECIETAAELRRCADGCTDGRYDWKADGADDCADAIRALGRQHD